MPTEWCSNLARIAPLAALDLALAECDAHAPAAEVGGLAARPTPGAAPFALTGFAVPESAHYALWAGDTLADEGKCIVIWRRTESWWKLHRDIFNTSRAPGPVAQN